MIVNVLQQLIKWIQDFSKVQDQFQLNPVERRGAGEADNHKESQKNDEMSLRGPNWFISNVL